MPPPLINSVSGDVANEGGSQFLGNSFQNSTVTFNHSAGSNNQNSKQVQVDDAQEQHRELLKALDFPYRQIRLAQVSELRTPDESFSWIWDSNLVQWMRSGEPLFWISGKPASGKSTLMNYLRRHRRTKEELQQNSNQDWIIIYHFFDFRGGKDIGNNFEGFLRSLLFQLIDRFPEFTSGFLQGSLKAVDGSSNLKWTFLELEQIYMHFSREEDKLVCFLLDGLDEYEGNKAELVSFIRHFASDHKKVCLASRPDPPFPDAFKDVPTFKMETLNKTGILSFGINVLTEIFRPTSKIERDELMELAEEVARRALGVFLWARFAVYELVEGKSSGEDEESLQQRLEALSPELEDIYARIVKRRKLRERKLLGTALLLISHSHRPLSIGGLYSALSIASKVQNDTELLPGPWKMFGKRLVAIAGGMIDISITEKKPLNISRFVPDSNDIRYIHFVQTAHKTVQKYLELQGWLELLAVPDISKYAPELWLKICVQYLRENEPPERKHNGEDLTTIWDELGNKTEINNDTWNSECKESPELDYSALHPDACEDLLDYTVEYMASHASETEQSSQKSTFSQFRPVITRQFLTLHRDIRRCPFSCQTNIFTRSILRSAEFAATHALELSVKDFLTTEYTQHKVGKPAVTTKKPFGSRVRRLLSRERKQPMVDDVVQRLIQIPLIQSRHNLRTWGTKYMGIVQACLAVSGRVSDDSLVLAIWYGVFAFIELLLTYRRDRPLLIKPNTTLGFIREKFDYRDIVGNDKHLSLEVSALHLFATGHQSPGLDFKKTFQLLLASGEDINAQCDSLGTPLNVYAATVMNYYPEFVELFVQSGADINRRGPLGNVLEMMWYRLLERKYLDLSFVVVDLITSIRHLISLGGINNKPDPNGRVPSKEYMLNLTWENLKEYQQAYWGETSITQNESESDVSDT